ncbi:MAG: GFA family protein [Microcoleus sp. SIO2G3]|nr:GFA family protein [Microcoleus sp. SIO2G3]
MKNYRGSCHCGKVQFEVTTNLERVVRCNCSLCSRRGAIMHRVPAEQFTLIAGEDYLTLYQFHTKTAKHYFCKICGIYPFHRPRVAPDFYGINVACLEDVDTFKLEPGLVDGRSYE